MRKLATIRQVAAITAIPNADAIECVTVDGWRVVSKRGEFALGDLCVYFEIDSVLPERQEFEFLRKSSYVKNEKFQGFRLKTIRLRGQISQGLVLPMLPELTTSQLGDDVTELLGVIKWEPSIPAQLSGVAVGRFPSFIPHTDQERIQNLTAELAAWGQTQSQWEITEKLDGTSMTVFYNQDHVGVCGRNWELSGEGGNSLWAMARKLDLPAKLTALGRNIALQGELIGQGIQGNHYQLVQPEFRLFDVWDIDAQQYLNSYDRELLCRDLGVLHCPILSQGVSLDSSITVDQLLARAEGGSNLNPARTREGLVYKCINDPSVSFKAISNQFLLGEK
jgi:RNA ligase (TIGR02306 family)